jgi:hypothetical protein
VGPKCITGSPAVYTCSQRGSIGAIETSSAYWRCSTRARVAPSRVASDSVRTCGALGRWRRNEHMHAEESRGHRCE